LDYAFVTQLFLWI